MPPMRDPYNMDYPKVLWNYCAACRHSRATLGRFYCTTHLQERQCDLYTAGRSTKANPPADSAGKPTKPKQQT